MVDVVFDPPIESLIAKLKRLEGNLPTKGMRTALVASVAPLKRNIKTSVRDVTGSLRKSIGHRSISKSAKVRLGFSSDEVALLVGATRKVAGSIGAPAGKKWDQNYKLNWLERGVRPHTIPDVGKTNRFRGRKVLKFGGGYAISVEHPGFSGRQIVWKALQATRSRQQSLFNRKLHAFLDRHIG
ncbi:MAG: hypothetical protein KZQ95_01775 [Candidatus Thiodiazotropha sp. (ex Epidulcina cf. delphinae)]|nr:hypothetical protein [Candidatus Thiodiazotropha sp. (ex Epidulcina cf. delphinae)]